jgi:isochorismate synthase
MTHSTLSSTHTHLAPQRLLETTWALQWPTAVWRLPRERTIHWLADTQAQPLIGKLDLEESPAGFAVAPFINPEGGQTRLLRADLYGQWPQGTSPDLAQLQAAEGAWPALEQLKQGYIAHTPAHYPVPPNSSQPIAASQTQYEAAVAAAITSIKEGVFQKVVLSRTKRSALPSNFELYTLFMVLCEAYPQAFVYTFSIPGEGTWVGATPETLIQVEAGKTFRTVALAGTQSHLPERPLSQAPWTQKEIAEQALVSRYIINCFKKIRLREFEEQGPRTVVAGHLIHLQTDFVVDMEATNFPQLGTVMLDLLHPTSAICGMPQPPAQAFLLAQEGYERGFYSGYLGPVNIADASRLFVNLRCIQLTAQEAIAYAGAGITEDSDPRKEWLETEMKCQTVLRHLAKSEK